MSEHFERLFALPKNMAVNTAPVKESGAFETDVPLVLEAGELYKGSASGTIVGQLKFMVTDSAKIIKALYIRLFENDISGNSLGTFKACEYLDLNAEKNSYIGGGVPIVLSSSARSFSVSVEKIVFADNSVTEYENAVFTELPPQQSVFEMFKQNGYSEELQNIYRDSCFARDKVPLNFSNFWQCACGKITPHGLVCPNCEMTYDSIVNSQKKETLEEERIAAEKRAEEEHIAAEKRAKRAKKIKKILAIGSTIAAVCIAFVIVLTTVIIPTANRNKAYDIYGNVLNAANVGDTISFGKYEQDNNTSNGKEDVEWLVLAKENGKVLVTSKYALDCKRYNTSYTDVTWETCSLREWLNGEFLNNAFTDAEQSIIATSTVSADKNPDYDTNPGNATNDKVFLLSITEAEKYFPSDSARQCEPTKYVVANGEYLRSEIDNCCWWWLRSPGYDQDLAAGVCSDGNVHYFGLDVDTGLDPVRPALWINLES